MVPPEPVPAELCRCDYMGGSCDFCIDYIQDLIEYEAWQKARNRDLREVYPAR